jgi:hypothetical protein
VAQTLSSAGNDEAAAIAAAIARFQAETAPVSVGEEERLSPWQRAALIEGVSAKPGGGDPKGGAKWLS